MSKNLTKISGQICIDEMSIDNIPLSKLRSSLSTIPQDPSIFSETVRKNLDPKGEYDDEKLWEVLEKVQLKPVFEKTGGKLHYELREEGANASSKFRKLSLLKRFCFLCINLEFLKVIRGSETAVMSGKSIVEK